jgi:filamentous hemagglutinin family protein
MQSAVIIIACLAVSTAQVPTSIISDLTLGTEVIQRDRMYEITGGTRPEHGSNLFHSFDRFNIGSGDTAHFVGTPGVSHIIGRVTGGAESMIDGRLQSDATLFLLNPSGLLFGPNARLDIAGSFYASTADVLRFEDGGEFAVHVSEQSVLSVAAPSAFGFVNENPADMTIQRSTLVVPAGEVLSLVGGDLDVAGGSLRALSGQINLVSVASAGEVTLDGVRVDSTAQRGLGSITMTESRLEASGQGGGRVAGQIVIRGAQLTMVNSLMRLTNRSDQEGEGVDVKIDDTIVLDGTNILSDTLGTGQGGHIVLQAESLRMEKNGLIQSDTFGAGRGGTIELAVGMLTLEAGAGIVSNSRRPNSGAAGAIVIHGRGGDRTAAHLVTLRTSTLQTNTEGEGDGGTITVTAEAVELSRANLTAATTGAGAAGAITLNATRLNATDQTLITSSSTATATGDAGRIAIQGVSGTGAAATVALTDSELRTETSSGLGGTVTVTADAIDLIHANLTAATTGATDAGAITLNVDHLNAADQTRITSSSTATATGNAGRVTIQGIAGAGTASRIVVLSNSAVQTQAVSDQANGGAVRVQSQLIELRDKSAISSDTTRGQRGGDIDLDATLVLLENSDIIANSVAAQEKADINISGALILSFARAILTS